MSKEAMKLALEALEVATTPLAQDRQEVLRAQAAIREALAEPDYKALYEKAAQQYNELAALMAEQPAQQKPDELLLSFYQATDYPSLVSAMDGHIKKMQRKLQSNPHTAIDAWNNREMMRSAPQPPAHRTEQHLEMMDAYCKAWEQSFTADNPCHTVKMTADDRKHIEAGLKAALADHTEHPLEMVEQPAQQQPYGWKVYGVSSLFMGEFAESDARAEAKRIGGTCITFPLYTSPPASKPWVGLTEFDIDQIPYSCSHAESRLIAYAIEAKLKEKNV